MKYDNSGVRRQDRLLEEENALELLGQGEYGVLSMVAPEGGAYGIPVNFVYDGKEDIYVHCAPQGRKLRCIAACPDVSFCIVGPTGVVPEKFTTNYSSVVLACRAEAGLSADERMHGLRLLLEKYCPADLTVGAKYAEKSFHRTEVIRLHILSFSGKCKRVG